MRVILKITLLASLLVAAACGRHAENLLTGKWRVVSYADPFKATLGSTEVAPGKNFILQFHDANRFTFTTDCNTVSGEYAVSGSLINFDNLSATELACDNEALERSVKSELPMVESYFLTADTLLCLLGSQGNVLMKFIKQNQQ